MATRKEVINMAAVLRLITNTCSPRDGRTRYSFYESADAWQNDRKIATCMGSHDAMIFLDGYAKGMAFGVRERENKVPNYGE